MILHCKAILGRGQTLAYVTNLVIQLFCIPDQYHCSRTGQVTSWRGIVLSPVDHHANTPSPCHPLSLSLSVTLLLCFSLFYHILRESGREGTCLREKERICLKESCLRERENLTKTEGTCLRKREKRNLLKRERERERLKITWKWFSKKTPK